MAEFLVRDGHVVRIGDRVTLRETYANKSEPGTPERDKAFGPEAKDAIGTVMSLQGNTVYVQWDHPEMIDAMYRDNDTEWSPLWFDVIGHLDFSSVDKIENYLNGRATNDTDQLSR